MHSTTDELHAADLRALDLRSASAVSVPPDASRWSDATPRAVMISICYSRTLPRCFYSRGVCELRPAGPLRDEGAVMKTYVVQ
ncbi:hypothetical protein CgunFtcFv8_015976 [Champsocephalus gunnari]|uniref:Uncharacterized protein n=1 Tax=Champsocephalus gunnari TaxID=52237 RepID=A0AAN8C6Z7_CHAGU|nr:hypothetical protein CgunFtcFv8_015976 [Champsocephalus gunnari]